MPGSWDGKSRPSNKKYRDNFDEIFKKKTRVRMARGETVRRSSVRAGSKTVKRVNSNKKDSGTTYGKILENDILLKLRLYAVYH